MTQTLRTPILRNCVLTLVAIALIVVIPLLSLRPSLSVEFTPPDRGSPEQVDAGGTRFADFERPGERVVPVFMDGRELECPLSAILPPENYGLTRQAYPTIFYHTPPVEGIEVIFSLRDAQETLIYQTRYLTGPDHGTYGLPIPAYVNVQPLHPYQAYSWTVEIPDLEASVSGTIVRVNTTASFDEEFATASAEERLQLLADAGLWYDMLDQLARLHRENPDDPQWSRLWRQIAEDAELMKVGDKPLL
ncbi:MAG: DUF928 domain-containing protein [Phormidium sp. GEM2.Bin31]|nr:MAG: DUF928 domain-containing protein [Phormidium sp. GEM2.Bin31]